MAERPTGPVKPPVIDLTARPATPREDVKSREDVKPREESRPQAAETARPDTAPRAETPPRPRVDEVNWLLLGMVAVTGAVLGTILTYLVAITLPLPNAIKQVPDLTGDLSAQSDRIDALAGDLAALTQSTTRTQISLDATIAQLDAGLSEVKQAIADAEAKIPAATPAIDLTPLETELRTLKTQVDAIAAGASGADSGAMAQSLASLETGLSSLTTRLNGVDSTLSSLRTDLDAARQTLSDHINAALPNEAGPALKLPLILSGLESAFAAGKPFDLELQGLASVVPDLAVPEMLKASAATGLIRPDALVSKFQAALPEIIAARTSTSTDWTQNTLDWAKSLLALRPAEEMAGDSPEAIVSRLEGAMDRRDYAAAAGLLAQLPAPMQAAAAPVAADIAAHAAADQLVTDLRARALAPAETAP